MSAIISDCGLYRYLLTREINFGSYIHPEEYEHRTLLFIMLNPSTADATVNDATITRLISYAKRWGYGHLEVVNMFGYRSTDPSFLKTMPLLQAVGPDNDIHVLNAVKRADLIVCAWGTHGSLKAMSTPVRSALAARTLHALKITKHGHPAHPLYQRADLQPIPYSTGW